jgi:integrase
MKAKNKRTLTELLVTRARLAPGRYYDDRERGLFLRVRESGRRGFYFMYNFHGKTRWYGIGLVPLADARRIAARLRLAVAEGRDPAQARKDERDAGTFAELARRHVEERSSRRNRSWRQADYLVRTHLLPRWGARIAREITRADVRAAIGAIASPSVANQTRAAASAIFSFGVRNEVITHNPCLGVERHPTRSRERVLSDGELPLVWRALDSAGLVRASALKLILLTGVRPIEARHLRLEHVVDGAWWEMPGAPDAATGWPGTKNSRAHSVYLAPAVREIIAEVANGARVGFAFASETGGPVGDLTAAMRAISKALGVEPVRPHDLRRTFGTRVVGAGYDRRTMDRLLNHADHGVGSVYDRHSHRREDQRVWERVAAAIVAVAEGRPAGAEVVRGVFPSKT